MCGQATLPLLNKHGIVGLSFGAGTPPGKPDVPPLCVWRDAASKSEVVLTYETAYGDVSTVFVLPNGVALAVAWEVRRSVYVYQDLTGTFWRLFGRVVGF